MKKLTTNIKEKCRAARTWWTEEICRKSLSGITVIELVLILVKNLALYIEYIEGEKTLKNKLYTRYTQEHGQLILSKKGK